MEVVINVSVEHRREVWIGNRFGVISIELVFGTSKVYGRVRVSMRSEKLRAKP